MIIDFRMHKWSLTLKISYLRKFAVEFCPSCHTVFLFANFLPRWISDVWLFTLMIFHPLKVLPHVQKCTFFRYCNCIFLQHGPLILLDPVLCMSLLWYSGKYRILRLLYMWMLKLLAKYVLLLGDHSFTKQCKNKSNRLNYLNILSHIMNTSKNVWRTA